jgi:predicted transcriptional regulator
MPQTRTKRPGRPPALDNKAALLVGMAAEAGMSAKQIADPLGVSARTIHAHLESATIGDERLQRLAMAIYYFKRGVQMETIVSDETTESLE